MAIRQTELVNPTAELSLNHRAFHVRASCAGHLAVASADGTVSVVGLDRKIVGSLELKCALSAISLSPSGHMLAITLKDEVQLVNLQGDILHRLAGPVVDAWFDSDAKLWLAKRTDNSRNFSVAIYEDGNLETALSHVVVEDPFGDSALLFPNRPSDDPVAIWVAAGQDGQVVAWLELENGRINVDILDDFGQCSPPEKSPISEEFLLLSLIHI